jgi:hypothetical protein
MALHSTTATHYMAKSKLQINLWLSKDDDAQFKAKNLDLVEH